MDVRGLHQEYPDGIYHYVVTREFPFVPRKFMGTPVDETFNHPIAPGEKQIRQVPAEYPYYIVKGRLMSGTTLLPQARARFIPGRGTNPSFPVFININGIYLIFSPGHLVHYTMRPTSESFDSRFALHKIWHLFQTG